MALAGLRRFGQALAQFRLVWQRQAFCLSQASAIGCV
jgi:hypothetical protein